jgi:hypothetical protein
MRRRIAKCRRTHQMKLLDASNEQTVNSMGEFSLFCSITTIRNMDTPYIHNFLQHVSAH